jgi:xanthine dehydrogenase accessory factor
MDQGVYEKTLQFIDAGLSFATALVLAADGSTPQKAGARALIDAAGGITGTIGGGWVEAETQRRAVEVCQSGQPAVLDLRIQSASLSDSTPICGGSMRILLDPAAAGHRESYAQAAEALRTRRRGVLLTVLPATGHANVSVRWVPEDAVVARKDFPDAEAMRSCLTREMPRLLVDDAPSPGQAVEVFIEPVVPRPLLVIAGGGHVGQALAVQAMHVGFDVMVIDDRPEFTRADLFPAGATTRCGDVAREIAAVAETPGTYIVIVTRGHQHDAVALAACIRSPAAYIGMIGSRRKVALLCEDFLQRGAATQAELDRVFAPIGLDIGAVTVPEIATRIAAQLIAVRRKGRASLVGNLRFEI